MKGVLNSTSMLFEQLTAASSLNRSPFTPLEEPQSLDIES